MGSDGIEALELVGWEAPPAVGSRCLLVPTRTPLHQFTVSHLHTVDEVSEVGGAGSRWAVQLSAQAVPTPMVWFDLAEEVRLEGLVPLTVVSGEGTREVNDPATVGFILRQLGVD